MKPVRRNLLGRMAADDDLNERRRWMLACSQAMIREFNDMIARGGDDDEKRMRSVWLALTGASDADGYRLALLVVALEDLSKLNDLSELELVEMFPAPLLPNLIKWRDLVRRVGIDEAIVQMLPGWDAGVPLLDAGDVAELRRASEEGRLPSYLAAVAHRLGYPKVTSDSIRKAVERLRRLGK